MDLSKVSFWMAGRYATNCVEISDDPASLNKAGFWAVVNTFEGKWICARFKDVQDMPLPKVPWQSIETAWQSSQNAAEYQTNVALIKEQIAAGDIYQVNLCRVLSADCDQGLQGLANKLQSENPAPYASYFKLPDLEIASASPELFLHRQGDLIKSTPIKGTSATEEFGESSFEEGLGFPAIPFIPGNGLGSFEIATFLNKLPGRS